MKTFYITTPIYYVNDKPHIGHAYSTIAADVLSRYHRLLGEEVFFLTGTDENAQKNAEAAEKVGESDIQAYVDRMSNVWEQTWKAMGITNTAFMRTTADFHKRGVEKFWQASFSKGDIYEGEYQGLYCVGCEEYKKESDLVDGKCPLHNRAPEQLSEKNFFFRLTAYRQALLDHIDAHPDFIQPVSRRNEVRSYVDKFMSDVSVSRDTMQWGIEVPGNPSQRIYVWFDALINYLTGVGYGTDDAQFAKFWPAQLHLVGKDIIKFHCALWPAMLLSAGVALPERVFAHGFFTIDGAKISKSLGNAIDPLELANEYGLDTLRFFLFREISFGEDGDFSRARLAERYDGELANELGNLVNRVLTMCGKYGVGALPESFPPALRTPPLPEGRMGGVGEGGGSEVVGGALRGATPAYHTAMLEIRLHDALQCAFALVREANQYIDQQAPWKLAKEGKQEEVVVVLSKLLSMIADVAGMLLPFMPESAAKINEQLVSMQPQPIFPRRELLTQNP